ncbi:MAG: glutamate--tRNA ligase [Calditrichaceae bacterium]|nr:glutamate--tRNA ligase [Calditrichaceae bacterium]MBN2710730.1 glutamate--tRNA ligase [Calditrichaceae bacterium]RQV92759.1 MAG: glutamate--tRNA ligase [Calditrichota bacterium]
MKPIVRFAPSPTGFLHVGGARTAIFNWLIARKLHGKFLLRIEDTDRQRSTEESIRQILEGLNWLGLNWDDDIVFQSARNDRHKEVVEDLLANDHAYRCFCTPEELESKRLYAEQHKINKRYDGTCRKLSREQISEFLERKMPFSVRFKIEEQKTEFTDLIHGRHQTDLTDMDDFIIQRSDGTPVYQMAVVVDDHDMGVNLVLRGDDHLSNTPKQILLYKALGWSIPQFGHLPLILGKDKTRLSKRHGATSVQEFRNNGILPEALFNFLCLLGWNPGQEQEKMSREEIIDLFEVNRINHTPAVFDEQKLAWLNSRYMVEMPFDQLLFHAEKWCKDNQYSLRPDEEERFMFYLKIIQVRSKTLTDLYDFLKIYFDSPQIYDEKGVQKYFKKEGVSELLKKLRGTLSSLDDLHFDAIDKLDGLIRQFAAEHNLAAAKVIHPLRLALTGRTESPGIFELMHILHKDKVISRIDSAVDYINNL